MSTRNIRCLIGWFGPARRLERVNRRTVMSVRYKPTYKCLVCCDRYSNLIEKKDNRPCNDNIRSQHSTSCQEHLAEAIVNTGIASGKPVLVHYYYKIIYQQFICYVYFRILNIRCSFNKLFIVLYLLLFLLLNWFEWGAILCISTWRPLLPFKN